MTRITKNLERTKFEIRLYELAIRPKRRQSIISGVVARVGNAPNRNHAPSRLYESRPVAAAISVLQFCSTHSKYCFTLWRLIPGSSVERERTTSLPFRDRPDSVSP